MGTVRYIADGMTDSTPAGLYRLVSGQFTEARSYVRIEETAYDAKTKTSTLRIGLVSKTNIKWYSADALSLGGFGIKVNGNAVTMNRNARGDHMEDTYAEIAWADVELTGNTAKSCSIEIYAPDPSKMWEGAAAWTVNTFSWPAAKTGSYNFPLTAVKNGSVVYIGGEPYEVYIGNGTGLDRCDIYIGGEKY